MADFTIVIVEEDAELLVDALDLAANAMVLQGQGNGSARVREYANVVAEAHYQEKQRQVELAKRKDDEDEDPHVRYGFDYPHER